MNKIRKVVKEIDELALLPGIIFKMKINSAINICNKINSLLMSGKRSYNSNYAVCVVYPEGDKVKRLNACIYSERQSGSEEFGKLKKFIYNEGNIKEDNNSVKIEIAEVDLFEKSIYLYNCSIDKKAITGYEINKYKKRKLPGIFIFTGKRVKINLQDTNNITYYNSIENWIDGM